MTTLVWLQRELRLSSLPALKSAIEQAMVNNKKDSVILAYFHDPKQVVGAANSVWLAHSLKHLQALVAQKGGALWVIEGAFKLQFTKLIEDYAVKLVHYSHQVGEPFKSMQDQALEICQHKSVALKPFFSETLVTPGEIKNQKNTPYAVFTPFYKSLISHMPFMEPLDESVGDLQALKSQPIEEAWTRLPASLTLLMRKRWAKKMMCHWRVGEEIAWKRLDRFLCSFIDSYEQDRDFPALRANSRLSAHLHFGEINPRTMYFYLQSKLEMGSVKFEHVQPWLRQLAWAEFAKTLLWHFPETETTAFQKRFRDMYWDDSTGLIELWQKGRTGIPIIDAGMRELWETGTMHNRVRMLVASFLTKNLNQSWQTGKAWFDQCLVDADPANNSMGWQWVAGCGVDAAPYYRLFNPLVQSQKFDADGVYLRNWLPELKSLSNKAIHAPWTHQQECKLKGIELGVDYPFPVVDLQKSRTIHLERVAAMKSFN